MESGFDFRHHGEGEARAAELLGEGVLIAETGDALDLIASAGARRIVLRSHQLHPDFFRLASGLAGEILQKVSNYRIRLAVVGDFSGYRSPALRAFMTESNATGQVSFVDSLEAALGALEGRGAGKARG